MMKDAVVEEIKSSPSPTDVALEDIQHIETLAEDDVKGRDFTVSDTELPRGYFKSFNFIGSMVGIGAAFCCGVAGFSLVAPVLGFVNADIGPDPNLNWVALSYLLTTSIGLIIVGRVTDIFGRRWWFIGGNAVATVGSIVCAVAPNIPALIAGETLIGIGASVQLSYACELFSLVHMRLQSDKIFVVVVSELVPMEWRFLAQAFVYVFLSYLSSLHLHIILHTMLISCLDSSGEFPAAD
jgi:MFS family permease